MTPRLAVLVAERDDLLKDILARVNVGLVLGDCACQRINAVAAEAEIPYVVMEKGGMEDDAYMANLTVVLVGRAITHIAVAGFRPALGSSLLRRFKSRVLWECADYPEAIHARLTEDRFKQLEIFPPIPSA